MTLYRFVSADGRSRALTMDRTGETLPPDAETWRFLGVQSPEDQRLGVPPDTILTAIQSEGYFLLPLH